MRSGLALVVAAAICAPNLALTAGAVVRTTVTVRVYQKAALSPALERRALDEAATVLGSALVDVVWRRCTEPLRPTDCERPRRPSELSLRIVREGAPRPGTSVTLGAAFVEPSVGGVLATVYFDHVARLASLTGTDTGVLLGRAAAHELGHLLMRATAHPRCGLMRPDWTQGELRRNAPTDWAFTAGDVVAMRRPQISDRTR